MLLQLLKMNKQPNPTTHLIISIIKSIIRILAGSVLIYYGLNIAGWLIIIAEMLGILEELF